MSKSTTSFREFYEQHKKRAEKRPVIVPAEIAEILGRPPLLEGDDQDWYEDTRAKFAAVLKPEDAVIWIFVEDFAYYTAEILRCRRTKAALIDTARKAALCEMLGPIVEGKLKIEVPITDILDTYFVSAGVQDTIRDILGFTVEDLTARAFRFQHEELAAIEKELKSLEASRMAVLREIELRRILVARRLRETSQQILNAAEVTVVSVQSTPNVPNLVEVAQPPAANDDLNAARNEEQPPHSIK